jgi:hypothetical protein
VVNFGNTNYGQTPKAGVPFLGAPFSYRKSAKLADIADGTSNTLMMSEIIATTVTPGWGGPLSDFTTSLGGQTFNGWFTPNSQSCDEIARICPQPDDLNGIPCCTLIGGAAETVSQSITARSKHPGGVHSVRCDASVSFHSDGIELPVWRALSSSEGKEPIAAEAN